MSARIKIRTRLEQRDIRNRFRIVVNAGWILDADYNGFPQPAEKQMIQPVDAPAVWRFGGRHFEDLPANQLEAFLFGEDAAVPHPAVFIDGEELSGNDLCRHDHD